MRSLQEILTETKSNVLITVFAKLNENFGDDHSFKGVKPHHRYKTKDGHKMRIHLINNELGQHAVHYNDRLKAITKLTYWDKNSPAPSKKELEKMGLDDDSNENLTEGIIILERAAKDDELDPDSAGKLTEHSTAIHLINHAHENSGTVGSREHKNDLKPHKDAIERLSKGKSPAHVKTRLEHGRIAAGATINAVKTKHGPKAKITRAGQTSKSGDIGKFTKGKHNDGQENPSDVSVEISNSEKNEKKGDKQYEGFSVKSSSKSSTITAKNPSIHVDGMLDHSTRKLETDKVSRRALSRAHKKLGFGEKTRAERSRAVDRAREKEGVKSDSSLERKANEAAKSSKDDVAREFHKHLTHLVNNTGDEGHHLIGRMLHHHLTSSTSMPWSKVHAKGHKEGSVTATVTPGSDSPLNKVFKNKKTRYSVTRSGARTTVHKVEKDGSLTALAHYVPKTKSNALKENVHGWNVTPASH